MREHSGHQNQSHKVGAYKYFVLFDYSLNTIRLQTKINHFDKEHMHIYFMKQTHLKEIILKVYSFFMQVYIQDIEFTLR